MNQQDAMGQDSFLDIVANLVGILIILVVIIGAQAASAWQQPAETNESQNETLQQLAQETDRRIAESRNIELEHSELQQKIKYESSISARLNENRMKLLVEIESKNRLLDSKKQQLDESHRENVETIAKIESVKQKIQQVRYEFAATASLATPVVETIEHYPTPIAKTVFSDEVHFLLQGNRISHVPLDELVNAMKNEWKVKATKLAQARSTWESVGPIGQFRLQYLLRSVEASQQHTPSQYGIEFERFVVQPVNGASGEVVSEALAAGSEFENVVTRYVPRKTTVSIWVYPDSYEQLFAVRQWLRKRGFLTASWPLEFGQPISGGPNGLRTSTN